MAWIAFSWTTPALLAGAKTMTWRNWKDTHARKFYGGQILDAYDRNPRAGGRPVALIRLTREPLYVCSNTLADDDYHAEGLAWLERHPEVWPKEIFGQKVMPYLMSWTHFCEFRDEKEWGWVIRFELLEIFERDKS